MICTRRIWARLTRAIGGADVVECRRFWLRVRGICWGLSRGVFSRLVNWPNSGVKLLKVLPRLGPMAALRPCCAKLVE